MGQDEARAALESLRLKVDRYYTVKEVQQEMARMGAPVPGYAAVHHALMKLAQYGLIEIESPPAKWWTEWRRRFRVIDNSRCLKVLSEEHHA